MIATILSLILLLYALAQYNKGKYAYPFFILVFYASNAFIINFGQPIIKYQDFGILLLLGCCFLGYIRTPTFFSIRKQAGAKISLLLLLFFIFEVLYSLFFGIDTFGNILAVTRDYLYALTYFVFRRAPIADLKKGVILVFKAVCLASIFFVLQYITHVPLTNTFISESYLQSGNYRMQITPPFIDIVLLSLLLFIKKRKVQWFVVILMFIVLLISQNRTPLIALFMQIGLFVLLSRNSKHKVTVLVVALLAFPVINSLLASRAEEEDSSKLSLYSAFEDLKSGNYLEVASQNTFMFRIALIAERANYLLQNPEYAIQGVGAMHEDTSQKKFNFIVGTHNLDEKGNDITCQLNSIDVAWGPLLIRYGFGGLILHLFIIIWLIVSFYKMRQLPVAMIGFLIFTSELAQSFSSGSMFLLIGIFTISAFLIAYDKMKVR